MKKNKEDRNTPKLLLRVGTRSTESDKTTTPLQAAIPHSAHPSKARRGGTIASHFLL